MIPTQPEVPDNGRYTVTQTKDILEVSRMTIYNHINQNLLTPEFGKRTKRRLFSGKEIKKYWKKVY